MREKQRIALIIPKHAACLWLERLVNRLNLLNSDFDFLLVEDKSLAFKSTLLNVFIRLENALYGVKKSPLKGIKLATQTYTRSIGIGAKGDITLKFNGSKNLEQLYAILLSRDIPHISLGASSMKPMLDWRGCFSASLHDVEARLATFITAHLNGREMVAESNDKLLSLDAKLLRKAYFNLAKDKILNVIKKTVFYSPHWQVFYRKNPLGAWKAIKNPPYRFLADPFPVTYRDKDYIFVEDLDQRVKKGILSVVEVETGKVTPILEQKGHLSFPFIFMHQGEHFMLPESGEERRLTLFKATQFPFKWEKVTDLFEGQEMADATPFFHKGKWWMLASVSDGQGSMADCLNLYYSDSLQGQWVSHPQNPLKIDCSATRSAGAIYIENGKLLRPVQNCEKGYGHHVDLYEITELSETSFKEHKVKKLEFAGGEKLWRFHTYNRLGEFETVDGSAVAVKVVEWVKTLFKR